MHEFPASDVCLCWNTHFRAWGSSKWTDLGTFRVHAEFPPVWKGLFPGTVCGLLVRFHKRNTNRICQGLSHPQEHYSLSFGFMSADTAVPGADFCSQMGPQNVSKQQSIAHIFVSKQHFQRHPSLRVCFVQTGVFPLKENNFDFGVLCLPGCQFWPCYLQYFFFTPKVKSLVFGLFPGPIFSFQMRAWPSMYQTSDQSSVLPWLLQGVWRQEFRLWHWGETTKVEVHPGSAPDFWLCGQPVFTLVHKNLSLGWTSILWVWAHSDQNPGSLPESLSSDWTKPTVMKPMRSQADHVASHCDLIWPIERLAKIEAQS